MKSTLCLRGQQVEERLGPSRLTFELIETHRALTMKLRRFQFFGIPFPQWLMPDIVAQESGDGSNLHFHVQATLLLIGVVASYCGHLVIPTLACVIVVFDAQCLLCNGWVKFLLQHDHKRVFQYASIQGAHGKALLMEAGLEVEGLQTLLLVDRGRSWQNTAAIFRILHTLGWPWPWRMAWLVWVIPGPLRDLAYRFVARNRYKFFGRSPTCLLPPVDRMSQFLD